MAPRVSISSAYWAENPHIPSIKWVHGHNQIACFVVGKEQKWNNQFNHHHLDGLVQERRNSKALALTHRFNGILWKE